DLIKCTHKDPRNANLEPHDIMQTKEDLTGDEKKWLEANIDATNMILLGIPNGIYNSVDACKTANAMRQSKNHHEVDYDMLYDYLKQNEGNVNASRAKRASRVQDPLALVAKSYASPSSSQPSPAYCVTHTPSNQAYVQDGRINVQSKNVGNVGNGGRNTRRSVGSSGNHAYVQKTNAITVTDQRISRTSANSRNTSTVQCYNNTTTMDIMQEIFRSQQLEIQSILKNKCC
ncbi:hypothetical protein Tco_1261876, partial [Tanacetum coccineum]